MKKTILRLTIVAACILGCTHSLRAWEPFENIITLSLTDIYDGKDKPRTPVYIPQVGQIGYTLYFHDATDFTVNLYSVDEDDELVLEYTTFVPAATESIVLPSNLSGTYVIEVIRGDQHFEGEIEL